MVEMMMIALGSALGAVSRFVLGHWLLRRGFRHPVVATLAVNLSGCLLAGFLAGYPGPIQALTASLLLTGYLGSYTTVSSFSLETLGLWNGGRRGLATGYVLVSLIGGLALAALGWFAAEGLAT